MMKYKKIYNWLCSNKLSINVKNLIICFLIICSENHNSFFRYNHMIELTECRKYIRCICLARKKHIHNIKINYKFQSRNNVSALIMLKCTFLSFETLLTRKERFQMRIVFF